MDLVLERRGVDLEENVVLPDGPVVLDRHLDHASTNLRHDGDDIVDDPDVRGRGRNDVQQEEENRDRDDRKDCHADFPWSRPWKQLQLDEDEPDEERIDAEKEDFHSAYSRS